MTVIILGPCSMPYTNGKAFFYFLNFVTAKVLNVLEFKETHVKTHRPLCAGNGFIKEIKLNDFLSFNSFNKILFKHI